jgi:hypothetical protein
MHWTTTKSDRPYSVASLLNWRSDMMALLKTGDLSTVRPKQFVLWENPQNENPPIIIEIHPPLPNSRVVGVDDHSVVGIGIVEFAIGYAHMPTLMQTLHTAMPQFDPNTQVPNMVLHTIHRLQQAVLSTQKSYAVLYFLNTDFGNAYVLDAFDNRPDAQAAYEVIMEQIANGRLEGLRFMGQSSDIFEPLPEGAPLLVTKYPQPVEWELNAPSPN